MCEFVYCNPSLGLATKARAQTKREARDCGRMWEWTLTLSSELPFWELEFWRTSEFLQRDCRGQNPLHWWVLYIIGKLLKRRCLKWARMTHLDIWNTSCGQKKGRGTKVRNRSNFLAWRWRVTCRWKALDEGSNFGLDFISIGGLHTKLWGPKVAGVLTLAILGLPFTSPRTKSHLDVDLMERHTIRGKVVASPKFGLWWVLWIRGCSWLVLTPKMLQQGINQLVVWFCAGSCEWISCLSFLLVPSWSSNTTLYPQKCCEPRSMPSTPNFSVVFILNSL